ncbi:MAG: IPExxxVDY family protein [Chitinophagales bacterium]|nr:IPExxxVDY family protein [Chitinophagaceae bacterium]MCB9064750.1 IPExxxVDY family protein [Chitinophagales bacterium]
MAAKMVLDMSAMEEDFFSGTAMIGIGSSLQGHEFCWHINKVFEFDFVREPDSDVEYKPSKEDIHFFSLYRYEEPMSSCTHLLYKLRSDKRSLLPEIKQLDYLWLIKSELAEVTARNVTEKLRLLPQVQLAQIIPNERLKNINHLLL